MPPRAERVNSALILTKKTLGVKPEHGQTDMEQMVLSIS